jgi:glyoxylase-like metal-dependent hydrolase (beta-lactamase superfamily II)
VLEERLLLHQLIRESSGCASYVIASERTKKCILVDPLTDLERYESFIKAKQYDLTALVDTHTHADHLSGLRYFSKIFPNSVLLMHKNAPVSFLSRKLDDGDHLEELIGANEPIEAIYTPGHAADHICLLIGTRFNKLLSGDCLLIGDVGRTDLGRGNNDDMYDSLFQKLAKLPPDTEVYPAHVGAKHFLSNSSLSTTIGAELESNPALNVKSNEEFLRYMTEGWPPKPPHYQEIIEINLGKKTILEASEEAKRV